MIARKMTTPNDLYAMTPEKIDNDITILIGCYYNHVEESGIQYGDFDFNNTSDTQIVAEKVKIKYLKDFNFDSRRFWRLATVWFDGSPVMVIQNAGREGDDYHGRFITDEEAFRNLCMYLKSLVPVTVDEIKDVVANDKEIPNLTEFYGNSLEGYFDRNRY